MKRLTKVPKKVEKVVEIVTEEVEQIVETDEAIFDEALGKQIYIQMLDGYAMSGILSGINKTCIVVSEPSIVYETGPWTGNQWKDAQRLPTDEAPVMTANIGFWFIVKRNK